VRALRRERQPYVHRASTRTLDDYAKKKSLRCSEQQDPKVQKQRKAWQRRIKDIEPGRFKFLDQTNAKTTLTRVFARAPRGQRVPEYVPDGRWKSLTLMGTLGYWGDTTALTYEGGTDVMVMVTFIEKMLAPVLDRDHIVVLDRLSSHRDPQVTKAVRKAGARIWHLPPYSHDFNPIEQMWSKIKAYLRKVKPRDVDALIAAIGDALRTITAEDAQGWFSHCGYN
jgi:transposase